MTNKTIKANKGEWAELFVFLKALADGKIYGADENLNKIESIFYLILSAIKTESNTLKEYNRDENNNKIILKENGIVSAEIAINSFRKFSQLLLNKIQNGKGTFEIPEIKKFLSQIHLEKIKASSSSKKDIVFEIHDIFTGTNPKIGFSIKSYIGSNPTLLNASKATIVQYKLSKNISEKEIEEINSINSKSKIKDRVQKLADRNINLEFHKILNDTFNKNLQMIDSRMPEILSYLYLCSYSVEGKSISSVVDLYCNRYNEDREFIIHKVKDLLVAIALGMEPNTKWTGIEDANGGYIVVKDNGELLCYHIYDRNKLRNYLFKHTKFDSPSSKRTGAGIINIDKNGNQIFNLTVQIRF